MPGNDDAIRAIQLYVASIADAVVQGKASRPVAPKEHKAEPQKAPKKTAPPATGKSHSVKAVADEPAVAEKTESVAAEAAPAAAEKDNLTRIEGIGPKIEELLHAAGINTFANLGAASADDIRKILAGAGGRFAAHDPETWPQQSQMAADGKWDELEKWQDELDGGKLPGKDSGEEE